MLGPKFLVSQNYYMPGKTAARALVGGNTYFVVLKMEFRASETLCSMYLDSTETHAPDAVQSIPAGQLDTMEITSNFPFAIDEIRITDTFQELFASAPTYRPLLRASDLVVPEGNSGVKEVTMNVSLSSPSDYDIYAEFWTIAKSVNENDYVPIQGRLHFELGETSKEIVLKTLGDEEVEQNESFQVRFANFISAGFQAFDWIDPLVTILDDDIAPVEIRLLAGLDLMQAGQMYLGYDNPIPDDAVFEVSTDLANWAPLNTDENPRIAPQMRCEGTARFFRLTIKKGP